jgi:hypothetical protein
VPEPRKPLRRGDADDVRKGSATRHAALLDVDETVPTRGSESVPGGGAAAAGSQGDFVEGTVAAALVAAFVGNDPQRGELRDGEGSGEGGRHRARGGEAAAALD